MTDYLPSELQCLEFGAVVSTDDMVTRVHEFIEKLYQSREDLVVVLDAYYCDVENLYQFGIHSPHIEIWIDSINENDFEIFFVKPIHRADKNSNGVRVLRSMNMETRPFSSIFFPRKICSF